MTAKSRRGKLIATVAQPQTFVARLILAELIAKRGEGPLERRKLVYRKKG